MAAPELRSYRWQQLRARVIREETHCRICGHEVDKTLPGSHPWGPTVDHITPRARGGSIYSRANLGLAHRRCNTSKGAGDHEPLNVSRRW